MKALYKIAVYLWPRENKRGWLDIKETNKKDFILLSVYFLKEIYLLKCQEQYYIFYIVSLRTICNRLLCAKDMGLVPSCHWCFITLCTLHCHTFSVYYYAFQIVQFLLLVADQFLDSLHGFSFWPNGLIWGYIQSYS